MAALTVRPLEEKDFRAWNAFVEQAKDGTFFHLAEWQRVLKRAFRLDTHYLYAASGNEIRGLLPLARVRRPNLRFALVSTPCCVYGGALATDAATATALETAACELAAKLGVDYLELRNLTRRRADWPTSDLYATFRRTLDAAPEKNLLTIPRKERADIRKSLEAGLRSKVTEDAGRFFPLYARSTRNLGAPAYPKRYFEILLETFGEKTEIRLAVKGGDVLCGVLSFYFRDQVLPYYAGSVPAGRDMKAYPFLYWELMRAACEKGVRLFDFGRSLQGSGAFAFKKNWGFEAVSLPYQYHLLRAQRMPEMNPAGPGYRTLAGLWRHLPLAVANRLGPCFAPWVS